MAHCFHKMISSDTVIGSRICSIFKACGMTINFTGKYFQLSVVKTAADSGVEIISSKPHAYTSEALFKHDKISAEVSCRLSASDRISCMLNPSSLALS